MLRSNSSETSTTAGLLSGPLLVGVDWSAGSQHAFKWSIDLASRTKQELVLLHAISPWVGLEMAIPPFDYDAYRKRVDRSVGEWVSKIVGTTYRRDIVEDRAEDALLHKADEVDPGLVVVGAHNHPNWSPATLGAVTSRILEATHDPIAVVPESAAVGDHRDILVGLDGSASSERTLRWAATAAKALGVGLYAVCVFAPDPYAEQPRWSRSIDARSTVEAVESLRGLTEKVASEFDVSISADALVGRPVKELAETGADSFAIVLGKTGHGRLGRVLFGSTTRGVATHSKSPVIVIP